MKHGFTTIPRYVAIMIVVAALFFTAAAVTFAVSVYTVKADDGAAVTGTLSVHFIDCGQADSCVIQFPDGKTMLIDAGHSSSDSYTAVEEYIDGLGISDFDYFIITHADADHIGGVTRVFDGTRTADVVYRPSQLADNSKDDSYTDPAVGREGKYGIPYDTSDVPKNNMQDTATYRNALSTVYEMTDEVYVIDPDNDEINHIGGSVTVEGETMEYTFDFYSPLDPPYSDNNDYSPIMVLSYAGRDIVLSGDAEARNEAEFVEKVTETDTDERYDRFRTGDFTADVIKLGHHGSSTSSSEAYLDIMCSNVNARCNTYTVFSCNDRSYGNDYGHPTAITLQRIMDMEFSPERIERTDLSGNIRFDVGADGALMCTEETPGVTALSRLVSGENEKNPETQIADNGVRPTEPNGSVVATYFVTFVNDNGETIESVGYKAGDTFVNEPSVPEKAGYNGEWEAYSIGASNVTVRPVYTPIEYTITYNGLQGAENDNPATYTIESEIQLVDPELKGYTFLGWYNGDTKVTKIDKGSMGDITLVANWEVVSNPLLDLWNGLTDTQRTIAIVVVIIVVIVILAILIAVAVHKNKKHKKRRR